MQGPDKDLENHPDQIDLAIDRGYDCEIDLRVISSELWLGHDEPQYKITKEFLEEKIDNLWIHAKNLKALSWLIHNEKTYKYFWHQNDDFVITSNFNIWTYPGRELTYISIEVMPEWSDPEFKNINRTSFGICSDYVDKIKKVLAKSQSADV